MSEHGLKLGDAVLLIGLYVWVWIAIGPWYVGLILFAVASVLNIFHQVLVKR